MGIISSEVERAKKAFEDFTGHEAGSITRIQHKEYGVCFLLGRLDGVIYTAVRDGESEKYLHEFKRRNAPLLCCSADGKQLFIAGGKYIVTDAGIED